MVVGFSRKGGRNASIVFRPCCPALARLGPPDACCHILENFFVLGGFVSGKSPGQDQMAGTIESTSRRHERARGIGEKRGPALDRQAILGPFMPNFLLIVCALRKFMIFKITIMAGFIR